MNKGLRILYHHRTQGRGAEGLHIASIVQALEAEGHEVNVLSPPGIDPLASAGTAPLDKSETQAHGIHALWKFISRKLPGLVFELLEIGYNLPASWRLIRILKGGHYDLVYERYAFFLVAGAIVSRRFGIPFILEANEVSGIPNRARRQTFMQVCCWFERRIFARCTAILTVSSFLKELVVRQGVEESCVEIVPNAIDPEKFSTRPDNSELVNRYHLGDKRTIGFAGWFDQWDRLDLLIDVFTDLRSQYSDLVLVLIGDGAVLDHVRKLVRERDLEDAVIITGPVGRDEILDYLSILDIAVITHSNEFGSPVVMFEFMGLKIPLVAPRLPPIQDVLEDRVHALLFDALNMKQLRARLIEIIETENLATSLADNAYRLLLERHTWENNAKVIVKHVSGC